MHLNLHVNTLKAKQKCAQIAVKRKYVRWEVGSKRQRNAQRAGTLVLAICASSLASLPAVCLFVYMQSEGEMVVFSESTVCQGRERDRSGLELSSRQKERKDRPEAPPH